MDLHNRKNELKLNGDPSKKLGTFLAHPNPGDEVVISGLSGTYPESKNVHQFQYNLVNKIDMITSDNRRWDPGHPEIPHRSGKVPNIEKFDAGFFGVHPRQATTMDPMGRMILEKVIEALFDAGIHPSDLEGTNTGVFIGSCFSDTAKTWFNEKLVTQGFAITGNAQSMLAKRISYFLKLKGRSFICDTACSSSLYAIEEGYRAIRTGECDLVIVGGANLCLHPIVTLQFVRLGIVNIDGKCKVFDESGNGYARSDAIAVIILQKSKNAKRIYSTIVHAKTNCDGYKDSGITFPSRKMQTSLLKELYEECYPINSTDLSYLEAHGTGTKVGDPEELQAIEEVFLPGRVTPLLVGSVKSNIGHSEPTSGLCSVTKAIIAFETGCIPPNMHFSTPRVNVKSLGDGRLKVVTENLPFEDSRGLVAINNFGFGGGNCHVVLKQNPKEKINSKSPQENLPRLVCVSGRSKEAVNVLLNDVIENHANPEHIGLLHEVFRKNVVGHYYRGFLLVVKTKEVLRSWCFNPEIKKPLVICFGEIDEKMRNGAEEYLEVPLISKCIQGVHEVLFSKGQNIFEILLKKQDKTVLEKILARFTVQMIFADMLKALDIVPYKTFGLTKGLSLGTLVCAYFDGALNIKEVVECAYAIATTANLVSVNDGSDSNELSVLIEKSGRAAIQLQKTLKRILVKPRKLSKNAILEVTPSEISSIYLGHCFGNTEVLRYVGSAIQKNCSFFEVGNGYINECLKHNLQDINQKKFVNTTRGGLNNFLVSLGRLYELGHNPQIQKLCPEIQFPVSRGTPMISPKIKWSHSRNWYVAKYSWGSRMNIEESDFLLGLAHKDFSFIGGHAIDGRILFPATGYLKLVWDTLAHIHDLDITKCNVVFEDCRFKRACSVPKEKNNLKLTVMIQRGTGNFEVIEGDTPVVTGRVTKAVDNETDLVSISLLAKDSHASSMTSKDIYKELRLRGYNYRDQFRGIKSCDINARVGEIVWDGNWITFMDNMLQMKILQEDTRLLYVPTTIRKLTINTKQHLNYVQSFKNGMVNLPVYCSKNTGIIRSGFVEIRGLNASSIARRKYLGTPVLEKYVFVPNIATLRSEEAIRVNMQILLENLNAIIVKAVELIDEATPKDSQPLSKMCANLR